ncbi:MAG: hypothetical protein ACD_51C00238G0002 [uncultured bacterium]|nr:MAG: hypothetical protein ACD_51C00238G0002 [uncultured bacterium]OGJ47705.1 MAG: hypothetical protein A2244_03690 [Candidatus Peregrinibacteria bacterium RIFOXYA2_FULL_41_18]OGJ48780.1 MAG: hypothetical protein A2344_01895 [Candidatus Peregrinibacteria bacterium RIFOXYB12_FULL_41_12]OGJ52948.1 MAG: hypothetical protein A2448_04660 [Candidatus Peregrinibacteria bacterium RIFOXYC2_FULL_41_22]
MRCSAIDSHYVFFSLYFNLESPYAKVNIKKKNRAMDYKAIVKDAWVLTTHNRKLFWYWAFVPALLSIIVGIVYFGYQVMSFSFSPIFNEGANVEHTSFLKELVVWILSLIENNTSQGILLVTFAAIIFLLDTVYPTFARVALIQLTARIKNGQPTSMIDGVTYGALGFLKLFEYHMLIKIFGFVTIVTEAMFILRNMGWDAFKFLVVPFILLMIFGLILALFLTYTDYYIVIDEVGVIKSMGKSMKLVVLHWRHTILLLILMVLISARIIVNIILVLLVPSLIFLAGGLIATITLAKIGTIIGIIVGIVSLFFAAYFTGILEVFANAVWVLTFLQLTEEGEISAREKGPVKLGARDAT